MSIIVPVYNVDEYIRLCVDSILEQTFRDFELLLIDDGSSDNSKIICDAYIKQDKRVKVFHKRNGGVSSARNYGIEQACGQWICFIDGDDTVDSTYLDDFEMNERNTDMYIQGYRRVANGVIIKECKVTGQLMSFSDILAYMEDNNIINSPCFKLYNREIIITNNIRFDERFSYGEDHLFSLTYMLYAKILTYSQKCGYNYRNDNQISLTNRIIPYKNLTYYSVAAYTISQKILVRNNVYRLYLSFVNTYMENFIRTFKAMIASGGRKSDYLWILGKFNLSQLPTKFSYYRYTKKFLLLLLIRYTPTFFSFKILQIYLRHSQ